jgi:hypothetical protein
MRPASATVGRESMHKPALCGPPLGCDLDRHATRTDMALFLVQGLTSPVVCAPADGPRDRKPAPQRLPHPACVFRNCTGAAPAPADRANTLVPLAQAFPNSAGRHNRAYPEAGVLIEKPAAPHPATAAASPRRGAKEANDADITGHRRPADAPIVLALGECPHSNRTVSCVSTRAPIGHYRVPGLPPRQDRTRRVYHPPRRPRQRGGRLQPEHRSKRHYYRITVAVQ